MLQQEKIQQAISILQELGIDAWLIFARETEETPERAWELFAPGMVVWQSALILTRQGERIAIVGKGDDETYRQAGLFTEVHSYVQGVRDLLRNKLTQLDPQQIAIDYSKSNPAADGLTYGMFLLLNEYLEGTPYASRLISADPVLSRVRGRKTASELDRIRAAITRTLTVFDETPALLKPGVTEREVAAHYHRRVEEWQVTTAWDWSQCPIVNTGPGADAGHSGPTDRAIKHGELVHIDFGIKQDGYCSDLQRMWYVARPGETRAPESVQRAFNAVVKTIQESAKILKPGVVGWQVDARAREVLTGEGFPEYQHALGHQVGRTVHDGATLLGPRWERYGEVPYGVIEADQVFTLELGVDTEAGHLALEEDVRVTPDGVEWLAPPQTELYIV